MGKDSTGQGPDNGPREPEDALPIGEGTGTARDADRADPAPEDLAGRCRAEICPTCDVQARAEDVRLRALAETENLKKRLLRETEDLKRFAAESVLSDLLPVLDNLDLALAHTDNLDPACRDFVVGVEMTRKLFLDAVRGHGLEAVASERGQAFNPEVHEAVATVSEPDLGSNQVAQTVQNGYRLKGRLLRPAKVMVNTA